MRGAIVVRGTPVRLAAIMALTLLLGVTCIPGARAAPKSSVDKNTASEEQLCQVFGGDTTTTTNYNANGQAESSAVECHGGFLGGMICTNAGASTNCVMGLTQPKRPVVPPPPSTGSLQPALVPASPMPTPTSAATPVTG